MRLRAICVAFLCLLMAADIAAHAVPDTTSGRSLNAFSIEQEHSEGTQPPLISLERSFGRHRVACALDMPLSVNASCAESLM